MDASTSQQAHSALMNDVDNLATQLGVVDGHPNAQGHRAVADSAHTRVANGSQARGQGCMDPLYNDVVSTIPYQRPCMHACLHATGKATATGCCQWGTSSLEPLAVTGHSTGVQVTILSCQHHAHE